MSRTEIAPAPARKDFLAQLEAARPAIALLLPEPAAIDRVIRIARTAYQLNEDLRKCSPESIVGAVLKACELKVEPGGALGHAYLIPYRDNKRGVTECQFQLSFKGMLELARRSGQYRAIEARVVHAADTFAVEYDPEVKFRHVPALDDARGEPTHVYAYARLNNGALVFEVMSKAEVEHVRASSRCGPIWQKHWGEMARKTVTKRLLKRQPMAIDLAEAIEMDNREGYDGLGSAAQSPALERPRGPSRSADLARRLAAPPGIEPEPEFVEGTSGRVGSEADDEERTPFPDELETEAGTRL